MTIRSLVPVFVLLSGAALAACGGGGGSATPAPTPTPSPTPPCTAAYVRGAAGDVRLAPRSVGGVVPHQLFVTYSASAGTRGIQSTEHAITGARAVDAGTHGASPIRILYLPSTADDGAVTAVLRRDANVLDVSPVHYRGIASDSSAGANDQYFDNVNQWYLYKTNVVKTPNTTLTGPAPGAWNNASTSAAAVKIAVIDTGVDLNGGDQVDFTVARAVRIVNGQTSTGNAVVQDTDGHGTNTSGLAAALANNSYGFAGVGYNAQLMVYKVFPDVTAQNPCPQANTGDEILAINDAVANGATVISLSLGSVGNAANFDQNEQNAVEAAINNKVVVVAAAGNEFPTSDGNSPDYPAAYPNVIAVGASAVQDSVANTYASITAETVASYSNSGPTLVAPGGDASSTSDKDTLHWIEGYSTTTNPLPSEQCSNGGSPPTCRVLFNGTSQATPQVAGTVALMEAFHGGARSLPVATVTSLLTSTADPIPGVTQSRQGAGRLDAGRAVAAAHP